MLLKRSNVATLQCFKLAILLSSKKGKTDTFFKHKKVVET